MSDYNSLKAAINANIRKNGRQEITGQVLNGILRAMVDALGAGFTFRAVASPDTDPGSTDSTDSRIFCIATIPGNYEHMGGIEIEEGEVAVLKFYDDEWHKEPTGLASQAALESLGDTLGTAIGEKMTFCELWCDGDKITRKDSQIALSFAEVKELMDDPSQFVALKYIDVFWMLPQYDDEGDAIIFTGVSLMSAQGDLWRVAINEENQISDYSIAIENQYLKTNDLGDEQRDNFKTYPTTQAVNAALDDKVDKVPGKGLSSNDFTTQEKNKLAGLNNYDDTELRSQVQSGVTAASGSAAQAAASAASAESKYAGILQAMENLPDGSAVSAQVALNTQKITELNFIPYYSKDDMDIVEEEVASIENPIVSVTSGYISADQVIGQQISLIPKVARGYKVFAIPANSVVKVLFSELTGAYGFAITDTNDNVLESCTNQNKTDYTFALQTTPTKLWVSNNKYASSQRTTISKTDGNVALKELWESKTPNLWQGKKLWWCGTSIPAGSDFTLGSDFTIAGNYPKEVGLLLSASVENVAEGGSMCRANVRTGDYQGANYANITSALSMTLEEVESFIANYDTIKSKLDAAPTSMTDAYKQRMREASFEVKLLPYLDGRKPMPDLFVIDHGHNDYKYKMPDNSSDITLEPTLANISEGILAEDSFMTGNNNAKLESFFGSLANIPSAKKASFIASVNRNCYIGAINFIVTLILKYNPHARIMFVSNYEYQHGDNPGYAPLILAQQNISGSWAFPLCEVWKSLGYSNHIIPGSKSWFNTKYPNVTPATTDISVFRAYCPDMVHPHSDTTGDANLIYSVILSEFIKTIR